MEQRSSIKYKALEQSERVVNSEQNLHNKQWHTFIDGQSDQLQSSETVKFPSFERCIRTQIVSVPPVNTIPRGCHIGSVMMMMI